MPTTLTDAMVQRVIKSTSDILAELPVWVIGESMEAAMDSLVPHLHQFDTETVAGENELNAVMLLTQLIALIRSEVL